MGTVKRLPRSLSTVGIEPSSQDKTPIGRDFSVGYFYENGFSFPVKLTLKNGFSIILPPHGNERINNVLTERVYDFVVRVEYKYSQSVKIDADNILDVAPDNNNRERTAMILAAKQSKLYCGVSTFSVDYKVKVADFREAGSNGIYIPEVDAVITPHDTIDVVHPFSPEGLAITAHESGDLCGFIYRVEIVDPYDEFGHRFINIAGEVTRVNPVRDLHRAPGVYVTRVMRANDKTPADINPLFFTFEEAVKVVKLYRTQDEARAHGDLAEERKREYEQNLHELKMKNLKLEEDVKEQTNQHKRDQLELDAKKNELEHTQALLKALREERMMKLKDNYEERSYQRKDDSEWLKWVPAIIVGGGLLAIKLFWD